MDLGISSATWSLFGVIWPSSEVLARLMQTYNIDGKSVLEIGCRIAMPSLILGKRGANVTASDNHPEAVKFLKKNAKLNDLKEINFLRADWEELDNPLPQYDLIIGSDILYQRMLPKILSKFIDKVAKPKSEVILIDPNRGNYTSFINEMKNINYSFDLSIPKFTTFLKEKFVGRILKFKRE
jgi:predicted nicotinamide N-methyase